MWEMELKWKKISYKLRIKKNERKVTKLNIIKEDNDSTISL